MSDRILCVDDEPSILAGYQRNLRRQFTLDIAVGPQEGLTALMKETYAVVVSDMRMPGMDGIQFLSVVRDKWPETVRVMLTGENDLGATIKAVNTANLFRFLTKPCTPEDLAKTLDAALQQHRLITAEKELLEKTLAGAVRMLTDVLSLASPRAFGKAMRAKRYVRHICEKRGVKSRWQVELAAMLSQLGCITLPPEILERLVAGQPLSREDAELSKNHHAIAASLIGHVPRLDQIARMIALQPLCAANTAPDEPAAEGARIIYCALELDALIHQGQQAAQAIAALRTRLGDKYAPFLEAIAGFDHGNSVEKVRVITTRELALGMVIDEDVRTTPGLLLVSKGQEVTEAVISRLQSYAVRIGITEPFRVVLPTA